MSDNINQLKAGYKQGCFTVIGGPEVYQEECVKEKILRLEKDKQRFINGEKVKGTTIDSVEGFDRWIQKMKACEKYKCQCKCGKVYFLEEKILLRKKYRYCGNDCGLRATREKKLLESYKREKDESYDLELAGTIHESLKILECIDDSYEELYSWGDKRKYGDGTVKVYKLYKCICYLCKKEYKFKSSDFKIKKDFYGRNAEKGYYSKAYCDCHKISSFQWRTIKILKEHNVSYQVEVSFEDLMGENGLLRYDFAIFNPDGNIKYLIECQGEQHYKPVDEFGGTLQHKRQMKHDELKRKYAKKHNIHLIEIPYTCNTYEKEEKFLETNEVITSLTKQLE